MNSYSVVERINSDVNARVTYKSDLEQFDTPEFWEMAGKFGDCEDYALAKRNALLNAGWPKDKLGLCVVRRLVVDIVVYGLIPIKVVSS